MNFTDGELSYTCVVFELFDMNVLSTFKWKCELILYVCWCGQVALNLGIFESKYEWLELTPCCWIMNYMYPGMLWNIMRSSLSTYLKQGWVETEVAWSGVSWGKSKRIKENLEILYDSFRSQSQCWSTVWPKVNNWLESQVWLKCVSFNVFSIFCKLPFVFGYWSFDFVWWLAF